jgi:hypothetical protein
MPPVLRSQTSIRTRPGPEPLPFFPGGDRGRGARGCQSGSWPAVDYPGWRRQSNLSPPHPASPSGRGPGIPPADLSLCVPVPALGDLRAGPSRGRVSGFFPKYLILLGSSLRPPCGNACGALRGPRQPQQPHGFARPARITRKSSHRTPRKLIFAVTKPAGFRALQSSGAGRQADRTLRGGPAGQCGTPGGPPAPASRRFRYPPLRG